MTFCVLALDYDGTIAENEKPDLAVRGAIQNARMRGIETKSELAMTPPTSPQE